MVSISTRRRDRSRIKNVTVVLGYVRFVSFFITYDNHEIKASNFFYEQVNFFCILFVNFNNRLKNHPRYVIICDKNSLSQSFTIDFKQNFYLFKIL